MINTNEKKNNNAMFKSVIGKKNEKVFTNTTVLVTLNVKIVLKKIGVL